MIEIIKNDTTGQSILRFTGKQVDDNALYITLNVEDLKYLRDLIDVELDEETTLNEYQGDSTK